MDGGIINLKFSTHSKLNESIIKYFIVVKNYPLYITF